MHFPILLGIVGLQSGQRFEMEALSLSLAVSRCRSLSLTVSHCLSLSLAVSLSLCLSLSLTVSHRLSPSLAVSRCLSLSLAVSRCLSLSHCLTVSLSLTISHCLSLSLTVRAVSHCHVTPQSEPTGLSRAVADRSGPVTRVLEPIHDFARRAVRFALLPIPPLPSPPHTHRLRACSSYPGVDSCSDSACRDETAALRCNWGSTDHQPSPPMGRTDGRTDSTWPRGGGDATSWCHPTYPTHRWRYLCIGASAARAPHPPRAVAAEIQWCAAAQLCMHRGGARRDSAQFDAASRIDDAQSGHIHGPSCRPRQLVTLISGLPFAILHTPRGWQDIYPVFCPHRRIVPSPPTAYSGSGCQFPYRSRAAGCVHTPLPWRGGELPPDIPTCINTYIHTAYIRTYIPHL